MVTFGCMTVSKCDTSIHLSSVTTSDVFEGLGCSLPKQIHLLCTVLADIPCVGVQQGCVTSHAHDCGQGKFSTPKGEFHLGKVYAVCVYISSEFKYIISNLRMFLFISTSVMYLLGFLLPPAAVIMLLLLFLVMRSPPPTVLVQLHFVAVAPDVPAAGRDDQMQGQEPNDEQNDAEVAEWETPVQETGPRTRSGWS